MEASPLAKLLQLAAITKDDVVLEIGTGSGYATAVLSLIAGSVVSLEADEALAAQATATLSALGYDNVAVVNGELEKGFAAEAPYDLVFINGAVEEVPSALLEQLRDGGRLVAVVGYGNAAQAKVLVKEQGAISESTYFNASVKPLPGFRKANEREGALRPLCRFRRCHLFISRQCHLFPASVTYGIHKANKTVYR
jgi:protein-L-isoaspartate(D-aspartate) O-methyltransferase